MQLDIIVICYYHIINVKDNKTRVSINVTWVVA